MLTNNFTIIAETGLAINPDGGTGGGYMGVPVADAVFAYQTKPLAEGKGIKLGVYAGGQVKMGYVLGDFGLFGVGAAAGIEANMTNAPIAFSFDFRPGYAFLFTGAAAGGADGLCDGGRQRGDATPGNRTEESAAGTD